MQPDRREWSGPLGRVLVVASLFVFGASSLWAQSPRAIVARSENRPLASLRASAAAERANPHPARPEREIPNYRRDVPAGATQGPDALLQTAAAASAASVLRGFDGADNDDNAALFGFRVAPPDTNGDVGPSHVVQMINLVTTVFDKSGNIVPGGEPFGSNAFWAGMGGNCEPYNQGDPVVLYDERNGRWLVSQFAFPDDFSAFSQCVAISQSGNPLDTYNRYEFSFSGIGLPDYPKHGIVSDSVTMTANLFAPPVFNFAGTFIAAIDKAAMYAGNPATMVGFNIGTNEFGYVPGDLDDPDGSAGVVPALFATAMSRRSSFDVWQIDVSWASPSAATASRVAGIGIARFDADLCRASREACVPQPSPGSALEALSDRLMHRLQIRGFGSHLSMVAAHTVDAGGGRAGIRWYEMRNTGGGWSLYQQGTYAPGDGLHRWIPSIAMNKAGAIGLGYLRSGTSSFMSVAVAGQSAAASGSGTLDVAEQVCIGGTGAQTQTARAGDYSGTAVDPVSDTFWHTNEYGRTTGAYEWATRVCEFEIASPEPPPPATTMHVASIVTGTQGAGKGSKAGTATVTIVDNNGNPVAGATVTGTFGGDVSGSASGATGADGAVTLVSGTTAKGKNLTVTFCVSGVTHATLTYDPTANASAGFACGGLLPGRVAPRRGGLPRRFRAYLPGPNPDGASPGCAPHAGSGSSDSWNRSVPP